MFFIGLDLAWAAKNRTGIAVVDIAGRLQRIATAVSDEEIVQVIGEYIRGDCVVAIDALSFATVMGPPVCQGVGTTCLAQGASSWVVGAVSTVGFWRRR
jgi:hypothetical protein